MVYKSWTRRRLHGPTQPWNWNKLPRSPEEERDLPNYWVGVSQIGEDCIENVGTGGTLLSGATSQNWAGAQCRIAISPSEVDSLGFFLLPVDCAADQNPDCAGNQQWGCLKKISISTSAEHVYHMKDTALTSPLPQALV